MSRWLFSINLEYLLFQLMPKKTSVMSVTVMSVTKKINSFWPVDKKLKILSKEKLIQMKAKSILYRINYCLILYYLPVKIVWTFNLHFIFSLHFLRHVSYRFQHDFFYIKQKDFHNFVVDLFRYTYLNLQTIKIMMFFTKESWCKVIFPQNLVLNVMSVTRGITPWRHCIIHLVF